MFAVSSTTAGQEGFLPCSVVNVVMSFVFHADYCRINLRSFGILRSESVWTSDP